MRYNNPYMRKESGFTDSVKGAWNTVKHLDDSDVWHSVAADMYEHSADAGRLIGNRLSSSSIKPISWLGNKLNEAAETSKKTADQQRQYADISAKHGGVRRGHRLLSDMEERLKGVTDPEQRMKIMSEYEPTNAEKGSGYIRSNYTGDNAVDAVTGQVVNNWNLLPARVMHAYDSARMIGNNLFKSEDEAAAANRKVALDAVQSGLFEKKWDSNAVPLQGRHLGMDNWVGDFAAGAVNIGVDMTTDPRYLALWGVGSPLLSKTVGKGATALANKFVPNVAAQAAKGATAPVGQRAAHWLLSKPATFAAGFGVPLAADLFSELSSDYVNTPIDGNMSMVDITNHSINARNLLKQYTPEQLQEMGLLDYAYAYGLKENKDGTYSFTADEYEKRTGTKLPESFVEPVNTPQAVQYADSTEEAADPANGTEEAADATVPQNTDPMEDTEDTEDTDPMEDTEGDTGATENPPNTGTPEKPWYDKYDTNWKNWFGNVKFEDPSTWIPRLLTAILMMSVVGAFSNNGTAAFSSAPLGWGLGGAVQNNWNNIKQDWNERT